MFSEAIWIIFRELALSLNADARQNGHLRIGARMVKMPPGIPSIPELRGMPTMFPEYENDAQKSYFARYDPVAACC
jgi:hypothetical protein